MANLINEAQIQQKWTPLLETLGVDASRRGWMARYAHFHSLNESAGVMGGVSYPYANLYNVPGVGNAVPAQQAAMGAGSQFSAASKGSGDKWGTLLPLALQVAAKTVGFDVVNVFPMQNPTGVIPYMDYVYAGAKQPYGAPPAYNSATQNPAGVAALNGTPLLFKVDVPKKEDSTPGREDLVVGTEYTFTDATSATATLVTKYVGKSRISGQAMFRVMSITDGKNLADVFGQTDTSVSINSTSVKITALPQLVSTLEDQVQGFAGAGPNDDQNWSGNWVDPTTIYDPMLRGVGEDTYARSLGLQVFTKFVQVGTFKISVNVTQEQIQDLNRQWGIDVVAMVENAGINEITQSINKNILSRLFALGWKNHGETYWSEGANYNLDLTNNDPSTPDATFTAAIPVGDANDGTGGVEQQTMTLPKFLSVAPGATFENQDTVIKRIATRVLSAANMIAQRGRRGSANFIVTNVRVASLLQSNAQYAFSPTPNTLSQNSGDLYPLGKIWGMMVYVDPNMAYSDTRILVGRKGDMNEPGVAFCPYLLAESVKLIAEGTAAPKVIVSSRYALVDYGFYPQTQYMTLYVKLGDSL